MEETAALKTDPFPIIRTFFDFQRRSALDHRRQCLRIGAAAILCALLLRLDSSAIVKPITDFLTKPKTASWLIYLETGRIVRFSPSPATEPVFSMESNTPDFAQGNPELTPLPNFEAQDAEAISIRYNCALRPDLELLIAEPLRWDLTGEEPAVLILHTHGTESYTPSPGEDYEETSPFRTLDDGYNMISIGTYLTQLLEEGGIRVIHDKTTHDYPSYNGSYNHARKSITRYLDEYPSIQLILDLHRDASGTNTNQMRTEATVNGQPSAQLMLVIGTSASGLKHPDWEKNLALGLKLHAQCERIAPGIMRYVNLRAQRFNQDLSPGALLIEVGAAGNTHTEALTAAKILAQGILSLAQGTVS